MIVRLYLDGMTDQQRARILFGRALCIVMLVGISIAVPYLRMHPPDLGNDMEVAAAALIWAISAIFFHFMGVLNAHRVTCIAIGLVGSAALPPRSMLGVQVEMLCILGAYLPAEFVGFLIHWHMRRAHLQRALEQQRLLHALQDSNERREYEIRMMTHIAQQLAPGGGACLISSAMQPAGTGICAEGSEQAALGTSAPSQYTAKVSAGGKMAAVVVGHPSGYAQAAGGQRGREETPTLAPPPPIAASSLQAPPLAGPQDSLRAPDTPVAERAQRLRTPSWLTSARRRAGAAVARGATR